VAVRLPGSAVAAGDQQWAPAEMRVWGCVTVENEPFHICCSLQM